MKVQEVVAMAMGNKGRLTGGDKLSVGIAPLTSSTPSLLREAEKPCNSLICQNMKKSRVIESMGFTVMIKK